MKFISLPCLFLLSVSATAQLNLAPPALDESYKMSLYIDKCVDGSCKEGETGTLRFKSYYDLQEFTGTFGPRRHLMRGKLLFRNGDTFEGAFTERPYRDKEVFFNYDSGTYHKAGAYTYTAKFINGKPNGPTTIRFDDGGEFRGTLNNGYYEGPGFIRYNNGATYQGGLHGGVYHGRGRVEYNNGLIYDGNWVNGKRIGFGTFTDKTKPGYWFAGEFKDDYPNGLGKLIMPGSNDTIIGVFNGGHRNGVFAIKKPGASPSYTFFRNDSAVYTGLVSLPDDRYCIGGTCQTGKGKMIDKAGNLFEGTVKAGKLEGQGSAEMIDGSRYIGVYAANQPTQGRSIYANGNEYDGPYVNGFPEGKGTFKWKSGDTYVGDWKNGYRTGHGLYTWGEGKNKGDRYEGEWEKGEFAGQAVFTQANGRIYKGRFNNNGIAEGTLTLPDGTVYESAAWNNYSFTSGTRRSNGASESGGFDGTSFQTTAQQQATDYADKHPWLQGTIPVARRQADLRAGKVQKTVRTEHSVRDVNLYNGSFSKVLDWDMLASFNGGFKRYYMVVSSAGKKFPVPFGMRITYEFIDAKGALISRQETTDFGYEGSFDAPADGTYTIQAKFDLSNCIGCQPLDGARLKFTLISWDYAYPNK